MVKKGRTVVNSLTISENFKYVLFFLFHDDFWVYIKLDLQLHFKCLFINQLFYYLSMNNNILNPVKQKMIKKRQEPFSVLIVDTHTVFRHSLRVALENENFISLIIEAPDGQTAFDLASKECPDIIITDVFLSRINGVELVEKVNALKKKIQVVVLAQECSELYVMSMMDAGASGFLFKTCSLNELKRAILTVSQGKQYLCPAASKIILDMALNPCLLNGNPAFRELTARDRDVLQRIAEGKTSEIIGNELNVSKRTVDVHRRNLMDKLNIRSIAGLTKYAVKMGLSTLEK